MHYFIFFIHCTALFEDLLRIRMLTCAFQTLIVTVFQIIARVKRSFLEILLMESDLHYLNKHFSKLRH